MVMPDVKGFEETLDELCSRGWLADAQAVDLKKFYGLDIKDVEELKSMAKVDWDAVSDFERYPKLDKMKIGDSVNARFEDDGTFVAKKSLQDAGAKYPRDSFVFVLAVSGEKKEFWVGAQAYSMVRQIKRLRDANGGTLKGLKAKIKRVSESNTETNYEISAA